MVRVLIHICCAPCLTFPLKELRAKGFVGSGFFYNPNIHPLAEHQRRLKTVEDYSSGAGLDVIYHPSYDIETFFRQTAFKEDREQRCEICHRLRLKKTAQVAKTGGFDFFTTTLLVSPHQQHERIKEVGVQCGAEVGLEFYYQDFRKGFHESVRLSKEAGLYRQNYCGCIFSERERFIAETKKEETQKCRR